MELGELGVTPQKLSQFNKKKIYCAEDLVRFFPRDYLDFSKEIPVSKNADFCCFTAKVVDVGTYTSGVFTIYALLIDENNNKIKAMWFRQSYLHKQIKERLNKTVFIAGKPVYDERFHNYTISMPVIFTQNTDSAKRIYPVYKKISGMSESYLEDKIQKAVSCSEIAYDRIPSEIVKQYNLYTYKEALTELHFPSSMDNIQKAKRRITFEDLLYFSSKLEQINKAASTTTHYKIKSLKILNQIFYELPFELTDGQKDTIRSLIARIRSGRRIDALIQGDVGCGKTIIAIMLMAAMVSNGYQVALMAPTQVLAKQHYDDLCNTFEHLGVKVAFMGSKMKAKEKKAILEKIASGEVSIVVGTHAILNDSVVFKNLALTITDEEHRFGTIQRDALTKKSAEGVHSITMSATPIPRSLAQVLYGDNKQLYTITTMPKGRLPVKTVISDSYKQTFSFLRKELQNKKQIYVVCPMIEQNDNCEKVKSVEEIEDIYKKEFAKDGYKIATLTGKTPKSDTENIINSFKNGDIDILVSTTVIEVGVNVPNASVIVIHNAERFGLASLHQLRGRVGRSAYQSYCILFSEKSDNERLNVLVNTNNGFVVAEQDLAQRGAGNFIGVEQSGFTHYMALMFDKPEIYKITKKIAHEWLPTGQLDELVSYFDSLNDR